VKKLLIILLFISFNSFAQDSIQDLLDDRDYLVTKVSELDYKLKKIDEYQKNNIYTSGTYLKKAASSYYTSLGISAGSILLTGIGIGVKSNFLTVVGAGLGVVSFGFKINAWNNVGKSGKALNNEIE